MKNSRVVVITTYDITLTQTFPTHTDNIQEPCFYSKHTALLGLGVLCFLFIFPFSIAVLFVSRYSDTAHSRLQIQKYMTIDQTTNRLLLIKTKNGLFNSQKVQTNQSFNIGYKLNYQSQCSTERIFVASIPVGSQLGSADRKYLLH